MQIPIAQLAQQLSKTLVSIYVISSDEELLQLEAVDQIRQVARKNGFIEREVLHVGTHFKWEE